jgi:hypothetical protein
MTMENLRLKNALKRVIAACRNEDPFNYRGEQESAGQELGDAIKAAEELLAVEIEAETRDAEDYENNHNFV